MNKTGKLLISIVLMLLAFSACTRIEYNMFGTLYGIVSDHETGVNISNATVTLSPGGKTQVTGADGRFEFKDLEPMQYTITVQKAGYQTNRKTVTAIADERIEANIPLTKN